MLQFHPAEDTKTRTIWLWKSPRWDFQTIGRFAFGNILLPGLLGIMLGTLLLISPILGVGLGLVFCLLVASFSRPILLCYLVIGATILTSGIERGRFFPVLAGNEVSLVGAFAIAWLVVLLDGRWRVHLPTYYWLAFIVLAVGVVAIPIVAFLLMDIQLTIGNAFKMLGLLQYFLLFWLFAVIPHGEGDRRSILWWMLAFGVLVALVGLLQGLGVGTVQSLLNTVYASSHEAMAARAGRITSLLGSWNSLGMFMMVIILMGWAVLFEIQLFWKRFLLMGIMAVCALCLLASGSFAGIIGLVVGVFILELLRPKRLHSLWVLTLGFIVMLFAVWLLYPYLQPLLEKRFTYQFNAGDWMPHTLQYRFMIWREIFIPAIQQHFPLPVYPTVPGWYEWKFEESQYILLLFRTGLAGFIGYMAWIILTLRWLYHRHNSSEGMTHAMAAVAFALVCVLVVAGFTNEVFSFSGTMDYLWILLALVANGGGGTS